MEENTEVIEETPAATIVDKSFGQEVVEALAVGIVSGVGTLAGFYIFGYAANKYQAFQARRAAKKAAKDVVETPATDTNNPEE
jgi:hypothetical protein